MAAAHGLAAAHGFCAAHGFLAAQGFTREELRGAQGFARQGAATAGPPSDSVNAPDAINALKSLVRFIVFSFWELGRFSNHSLLR